MIELERVAQTLQPWLGDELVRRMPRIMTEAQRRLSTFTVGRDDLSQLFHSLEGLIYTAVRRETDATFLVTLPDQSRVRMEMDDFAVIADELMWLLFEQFPIDARHLMLLRDYSVNVSSLSAIRALYTRFQEYETIDELKALRRVVRGSYPAFRWQNWLD
ncbi:MAG: hypothetical protein II879_00100 [Clostridia bacterium]|nr:hypothetical protein [Clostridia bacterium]